MSLPTRIYLAVAAIALALWLGFMVGADREAPPYASDPGYFLAHSNELTETLVGRVVFSAPAGEGDGARPDVDVPEGALVARVRARDLEGRIAVERSAPVEPSGRFEVTGLPLGTADVAVLLGGRAELVEIGGVVVDDSLWRLDPRLDPIDLGELVTPFEVEVRAPAGLPPAAGHLAWRRAAATLDGGGRPFDGLARVVDGRARFLTTTERIDVVPLIPGVRREIDPSVADGDSIRVGLGAVVDLVVEGPRPDPEAWRVLAHVEPTTGAGADLGGLLGSAAGTVPRHATGQLDGDGLARIPLLTGGPHVLRWFVSREGARIGATIRLDDPGGAFDVVAGGGVQALGRAFPMDEFLAQLSANQ